MSGGSPVVGKGIRLVFELSRADNPRLFDDLVQFPQGRKRVNRLRVLAYDGRLVQHGVFDVHGRVNGHGQPARGLDLQAAQVTNALFDSPVND